MGTTKDYLITYPGGNETTLSTTCQTVEAVINQISGLTPEQAEEMGLKVVALDEPTDLTEPPPPPPPPSAPAPAPVHNPFAKPETPDAVTEGTTAQSAVVTPPQA